MQLVGSLFLDRLIPRQYKSLQLYLLKKYGTDFFRPSTPSLCCPRQHEGGTLWLLRQCVCSPSWQKVWHSIFHVGSTRLLILNSINGGRTGTRTGIGGNIKHGESKVGKHFRSYSVHKACIAFSLR